MKKLLALPLAVLAAAISYYGFGYALAAQKATECEDIAFREAVQKRISGLDMGRNRVTVQRSAVTSHISPFAIEVTYSVPRDLHATIFIKRFRISPLGTIRSDKLEVVYLV